jgi:hypothetical protein
MQFFHFPCKMFAGHAKPFNNCLSKTPFASSVPFAAGIVRRTVARHINWKLTESLNSWKRRKLE